MPDYTKLTEPLKRLEGCFVAGGAITSLYTAKPIADFDIYPKTAKALEDAIHWAWDEGYFNFLATSRSLTFVKGEEIKVQIMHFDLFPTAEHIFENFDFTCCMGAFDLDSKQFILHDKFLEHCSQRYLKFNPKTRFPYASAWRVKKYEEKGFTIGKIEFHKILMACAEKPIKSWEDLKEQVGGVYGESFTIPENEPFSLDAAHKAMNTLKFKKDPAGYKNAEECILMASPSPKRYFYANGYYYVELEPGEGFEHTRAAPKNGIKMTDEEVLARPYYKKVFKEAEGAYRSHHMPKFKYKDGEVASSEAPYVFCYQTLKEVAGHYGGETVIEIKPLSVDDIVHSDGYAVGKQQLKRCIVLREVPIHEWKGR